MTEAGTVTVEQSNAVVLGARTKVFDRRLLRQIGLSSALAMNDVMFNDAAEGAAYSTLNG